MFRRPTELDITFDDDQLVIEGAVLEDVLEEVYRRFGRDALIVAAERNIVGGVGGFFGTERFHVVARPADGGDGEPNSPADRPTEPVDGPSFAAALAEALSGELAREAGVPEQDEAAGDEPVEPPMPAPAPAMVPVPQPATAPVVPLPQPAPIHQPPPWPEAPAAVAPSLPAAVAPSLPAAAAPSLPAAVTPPLPAVAAEPMPATSLPPLQLPPSPLAQQLPAWPRRTPAPPLPTWPTPAPWPAAPAPWPSAPRTSLPAPTQTWQAPEAEQTPVPTLPPFPGVAPSNAAPPPAEHVVDEPAAEPSSHTADAGAVLPVPAFAPDPSAMPDEFELLTFAELPLDELLERMDRLVPAQAPPAPAGVVAIVGDAEDAVTTARRLAARHGGEDSAAVVLLAPDLRSRDTSRVVITSLALVEQQRQRWMERPGTTFVAVALDPGQDGRAWAHDALRVLDPAQIRYAAPAWRSTDELHERVESFGHVDCVDLVDIDQAMEPAEFLTLQLPIASVEGRPVSPELWAAHLLAARRIAVAPQRHDIGGTE